MSNKKLKMTRIIFLCFLFIVTSTISYAQSPEQIAKQELERRGLGDEEVRARLAARGIDINAVDINNPSEVFALEKSLKEVIDEIEKEKASSINGGETTKEIIKKPLTEEESKILAKEGETISDAIDEGATLQEAVSEELIDAQDTKLPDAITYGQDVFRSQDIKLYRKSQDVKPPATYILGAGDIVAVSIWGYSEEDLVFEVNNEGYIKPEGIPRIYLKGIRLGDARKLLLKRFSNYYRFNENEFEVALNYGRTLNVSIVGEVYNFGSFNLPAINTAFNALVAAGGPNNIGSVRNIKLKRFGEKDKDIDIYKYLLDPTYASSFYLEEEDIIYVPVAEKLVRLSGAVIRPFRYELKQSEDLVELLSYAGGLKANASLKNIQIKRFENDQEIIIDVDLNDIIKSNKDFKLLNGDIITVNTIPNKYKNFARLGGAVSIPGEYAIQQNSRITDLLDRVEIDDDAFLELAYLKRTNDDNVTSSYFRINLNKIIRDRNSEDNLLLKNKDELVIYSKSKFIDNKSFTIQGNVRDPGDREFDFSNTLKLNDAVIMAGGLKEYSTDFAYLQRKNQNDPSRTEYYRINIKNAIENINSEDNIDIEPGDKIVVYSKAKFSDSFTVKVDGNVRSPGEYKYDPSLSLNDVIIMSGGLTFNASRKRIDLYRLDINDENATKTLAANIELDENNQPINGSVELQPFDEIRVRLAPEFENIRNVTLKGEVKYPGTYAILDDNETVTSLIKRAGGLTNEAFLGGSKLYRAGGDIGFVSVDFEKAFDNPGSFQDIIIKKSDEIRIPKRNDLVTILGEVKSYEVYNNEVVNQGKIVIPFEEGKNAKYYVNKFAGGVQDDGDKGNITVTLPNGRVRHTKRFLFWKKYPKVEKGSIINVFAKKTNQKEEEEKDIDWTSILTSSVAQATSLLTLLLLIQRVD